MTLPDSASRFLRPPNLYMGAAGLAVVLVLALVWLFGGGVAPASIRADPGDFASARTWIVDGPGGIVLVDPPPTEHAARALQDELDEPPAAMLLTGGEPSPLAGLPALLEAWPTMELIAPRPVVEHLLDETSGAPVHAALRERLMPAEEHPSYMPDQKGDTGGLVKGDLLLGDVVFIVLDLALPRDWPSEEGVSARAAYYIPYPTNAVFIGATGAHGVFAPMAARDTLESVNFQAATAGGSYCNVDECPTTYPRWGEALPWSTPEMVYVDWRTELYEDIRLMVLERLRDDGELSDIERQAIARWLEAQRAPVADSDLAQLNHSLNRIAQALRAKGVVE